jgi:hypothetical protein
MRIRLVVGLLVILAVAALGILVATPAHACHPYSEGCTRCDIWYQDNGDTCALTTWNCDNGDSGSFVTCY